MIGIVCYKGKPFGLKIVKNPDKRHDSHSFRDSANFPQSHLICKTVGEESQLIEIFHLHRLQFRMTPEQPSFLEYLQNVGDSKRRSQGNLSLVIQMKLKSKGRIEKH
jgi:hypothetical protein